MKRCFAVLVIFLAGATLSFADNPPVRAFQVELNNATFGGRANLSSPGMACWFWQGEEFQPEGYKKFIDLHREHSSVTLLTTSIRHPVEVTDPAVHDQIKRAAEYAKQNDMAIVMDLDVRLARQAYQNAYPDELQEIACLRETPLKDTGEILLSVDSVDLSDHYTFGSAKTYCTVSSRLLRAYAYKTGADGIEPDTVEDISARCRVVTADTKGLSVAIACDASLSGKMACIMAAFMLFTPDVFAPHLQQFERAILKQFADVPLAGACKDEWGFPGRFTVNTNDLWYSDPMALVYAKVHDGRDLVRDFLLMAKEEKGRDRERIAAINYYMGMCWKRNAELETSFYKSVKEVFGKSAVVATHPTWYPYPGELEAIKNGLDWWACPRDLAQTDESTPFSARTALAKRWNSPLWYNMYYSTSIEAYQRELWSSVLAGGRLNFHPMYPAPLDDGSKAILRGNLMRAEQRIRLLNYISDAPVECPVAVVFGHTNALNWAGDSFGNTGVKIADALWEAGYYADLIPNGWEPFGAENNEWITYGPQKYHAIVLFRPQYERPSLASLLAGLKTDAETAIFRVGDWTLGFNGEPLDVQKLLDSGVRVTDETSCAKEVIDYLKAKRVEPQTPGRLRGEKNFPDSVVPLLSGFCRLADGTVILASGEKEMLGDPIQQTIEVGGFDVAVDAIGVAGVRLRKDGNLRALAAGGLKSFKSAKQTIELSERLDVAIFDGPFGETHGVVHGYDGPIPEPLLALTKNWTRVRVPTPYVDPPVIAN